MGQGLCTGGHPSSPLQWDDTGAGLTSRGSCSCQLPLCRRRKRRRRTKAVSAAVRQRFGEHLIAPGQPAEAWGRKRQMRAQHDPRTGTAGTRQCPQPLLLPPSCTEQAGPVPSPPIPGSCQQPPLPLPSHIPCLERHESCPRGGGGGKVTFKELTLPLRYSPSQQRRGRRLKGSCVYLGFFHSKSWGCPGTGESRERVPSAVGQTQRAHPNHPQCLVKAPFNTDPPRKSPPRQHRKKAGSCQASPRTSVKSQQLPGGGEALLKAWSWDAPSTPLLPRRQRKQSLRRVLSPQAPQPLS